MTLFDDFVRTEPTADVTAGAVERVRLLVAYDGSAFYGFAANREVATVEGTLQQAIEMILQARVELAVAGRTDRGVHAWGQVISFDMPAGVIDIDKLRRALNKICGDAIVVREAARVAPDFDARFSARSRVYRYTVLNQPVRDPFAIRTAWWVGHELDLRSMQLACDPLFGEHDFSSFCRRRKRDDDEPSVMTRRVIDARWTNPPNDRGSVLRFEIEARAFCHQMVRSVVGTMIEIGGGKKRAGEMAEILRSRDRGRAGQLAPPQGLCLWEVRY
jgi:tRNA pseudouridine38-40 synthase